MSDQLNVAPPQRLTPDIDSLRRFYVGKNIDEVPKPSAILDAARVRRHCQSMLDAVDALGVGFRFHVKTHKTIEVTRLQAGEGNNQVNLVVSTIPELEHIVPLLEEYRNAGRRFNVLYGIPLPPSQVPRLAQLGRQLGEGSITVMIDHPSQLAAARRFSELAEFPARIFLKVDTGYHRAGLPPSGINKDGLIPKIMQLESEGAAQFLGLYSHSSLSYNDTTAREAMANLESEINGCLDALRSNAHLFSKDREPVISVGASPQATSVQNLTAADAIGEEDAKSLRQTLQLVEAGKPAGLNIKLELHAGVYSILDVQQLSTHSRTFLGKPEDEIGISIAAEVCSVYNNGERQRPEALVAVGVLGLGREPCCSYAGWGIVDPRSYALASTSGRRLIIERISQEHSIVSWERRLTHDDATLPPIPLEVGQSIRIYPNHACITGALYGWYLVVDSSDGSGVEKVMDVWARASGW